MRHPGLAALALSALVFISCKPLGKPGEACTATGDGFTRKDSCETMCVNWELTCPSGRQVTPHMCAGPVCGGGEACPSGFQCLQVDSVPSNARCMPVELCSPGASFAPEPTESELEDL
jgi:hypothetical protein